MTYSSRVAFGFLYLNFDLYLIGLFICTHNRGFCKSLTIWNIFSECVFKNNKSYILLSMFRNAFRQFEGLLPHEAPSATRGWLFSSPQTTFAKKAALFADLSGEKKTPLASNVLLDRSFWRRGLSLRGRHAREYRISGVQTASRGKRLAVSIGWGLRKWMGDATTTDTRSYGPCLQRIKSVMGTIMMIIITVMITIIRMVMMIINRTL